MSNSNSNTAAQSTSPKVSDEYRLSTVKPPAKPAYDPDKDYISDLLVELGQANAIVDSLWTVARENQADSLASDSLDSSLYAVLERLRLVKEAANAILDEMSAAARGAPPTDRQISAYATAAAEYGLPVWAMMVPDTTKDMFENDAAKIKRLMQLVGNYLACSDDQRGSIETMAAVLAGRLPGVAADRQAALVRLARIDEAMFLSKAAGAADRKAAQEVANHA